jgi:hypothetical protein
MMKKFMNPLIVFHSNCNVFLHWVSIFSGIGAIVKNANPQASSESIDTHTAS